MFVQFESSDLKKFNQCSHALKIKISIPIKAK